MCGLSASRTLPTICVHICRVSRVSCHSAKGSAGQAWSLKVCGLVAIGLLLVIFYHGWVARAEEISGAAGWDCAWDKRPGDLHRVLCFCRIGSWLRFCASRTKYLACRYAVTTEGVELPVVDVTHPAFSLELSAAEQQELVRKFMAQELPLAGWPAPIRKAFFKFALRGSILAQGLGRAEGTYLSGMHTYLLKLGPRMLGAAYSKPVDGKIAASLPAVGVRLRVQDMARFIADALAAAILANPGGHCAS